MAIVILDETAHRHAPAWYRSIRNEPTTNGLTLTIDQVIPIRALTMENVLDTIIREAPAGGDVILVCHARDEGLAIPVCSGAGASRGAVISALSINRETRSDGMLLPPVAASSVRDMLRLPSTDAVDRVRERMGSVRDKHLRHVALRGCNVGSWDSYLQAYKSFFGCQSLSGPRLRDTFGEINTGRPLATSDLERWRRAHPSPPWHQFTAGPLTIATRGGESEEHRYTVEAASPSVAELSPWIAQALPSSNAVGPRFYYHGLWRTSAAPGSARIHFVGTREYLGNLATV